MKIKELQQYLPEFVYGGIDGAVTTFAVVAGATGANLESSVVIILGFANLIADGFSMSVGSYLSHKADQHHYEKWRNREIWEVENEPEEGRREIREIYVQKGFRGSILEQVVAQITSKKDVWVDTMMKEELEILPPSKSPLSIGFFTFISFIVVGFIPLLVYVIDYAEPDMNNLFVWASILTSIAFVIIGILKSYVNERSIWRGIAETLFLGAIAAVLAYFVGDVLEQLFR